MAFNPNLPYSEVIGAGGPAVFFQSGVYYERDGTVVTTPTTVMSSEDEEHTRQHESMGNVVTFQKTVTGVIEEKIGIERLRDKETVGLDRQDCDVRRAGRIGVGNKAAVAFRFDDWQNALNTTIRPLLLARSIPFSHVLISEWRTATAQGTNVTADNITTWVDYGAEIFCHGIDHKDYIGYDGLYGNVVGAKATIESLLPTVRVQGWSMPGVDVVYTPEQRGVDIPYNGLTKQAHWISKEGRLLQNTYTIVEAYSGAVYMPITPEANRYFYGRGHIGLESLSLTSAKAEVDRAIRTKHTVRFMAHAGQLGVMSVADFTLFLDYVVTQRDAGLLDIVMPSSLPYVTNSTYRLDLMDGQGLMAGYSESAPGDWYHLGGTYNVYSPTGGYSGGACFEQKASGDHLSSPTYTAQYLTDRNLNGETVMFEAWVKSNGVGNTSARIDIAGNTNPWTIGKTFVVGTTWTKILFPFTIPKNFSDGSKVFQIDIKPSRWGGDGGIWSDMRVIKI